MIRDGFAKNEMGSWINTQMIKWFSVIDDEGIRVIGLDQDGVRHTFYTANSLKEAYKYLDGMMLFDL